MKHTSGTPRRTGTLLRIGASVATVALVASACTGGNTGDDSSSQGPATSGTNVNPQPQGDPKQGGSLTVALEAESNGWLPGTGSPAAPGYNVMYAIYDPLVMTDADGEVKPYLAESFESNVDFTQWTFKLRDGVKFHDGSALTADVIKQNVAITKAPSSNLAGSLAEVSSVDAVDALTVRYNLSTPNSAFPALLQTAPGMPFSMENYDKLGAAGASASPVGTGPFQFQSWNRGDRLTAVRNDGYWGAPMGMGPFLDQIVFRPIPDEDTRLQSLLSGDVDAFQTLRGSIVKQALSAAEDGTVAVHSFVGNNGGTVIFNTLLPPLDDIRVRKALVQATDQEQINKVLGNDGISPAATQFFTPDNPYFSQKVADAYPKFDADAAKALLDEYTKDPTRSDGKAVGSPVAVPFGCPPDPSLTELSQAYQAFWSNAGFQVSLSSDDQATHIGQAIGSPTQDPPFKGDFSSKCWRTGSEGDPYNILKNEFGPVAKQPLNFTNYTSSVLTEQLGALATTNDLQERKDAVEKIGLDLAENVPLAWAASTAAAFGVKPAVQNPSTWKLPDGSTGVGLGLFQGGTTVWGQVWQGQ